MSMHILVENSGYALCNHGDVAMLQVAVERLRRLWPAARITVVTTNPEQLARFCPGVTPLLLHQPAIWYKQSLLRRLHRLAPALGGHGWRRLEQTLWQRAPGLARAALAGNHLLHGPTSAQIGAADLVVATGGGYLTDSFAVFAMVLLDTLEIAARTGKPVAMLGQGLGPLQDGALRAKARKVLPLVGLIALREQRAGLPLLRDLGIATERVVTTGDDAIAMAYAARSPAPGAAIGVNLRIAAYSDIDADTIVTLRAALQAAAARHAAPLLPVPIAMRSQTGNHASEDDLSAIYRLLDTPAPPDGDTAFGDPQAVIDQIRRCRLVVTGSYHAGVFALAQGIPVVGMARSAYYAHKFDGLADQFGPGCAVVRLDSPRLPEDLAQAIDAAWRAADTARPALLATARRQIAAGEAAYERLLTLVEARHAAQAPTRSFG